MGRLAERGRGLFSDVTWKGRGMSWGVKQGYTVHSGTHQPGSHGRPVGPWAELGREVGTASGKVLLASLAARAWGDSPDMLVQGS